MTEFPEELRHYCRNPKCRSKLPEPVENERSAFCARGCYEGFYRTRCVICEEPMERTVSNRRICGKRRCRNAFSGGHGLGRYFPPLGESWLKKRPENKGVKLPPATDRGVDWAIAVNRVRIVGPRHVIERECSP